MTIIPAAALALASLGSPATVGDDLRTASIYYDHRPLSCDSSASTDVGRTEVRAKSRRSAPSTVLLLLAVASCYMVGIACLANVLREQRHDPDKSARHARRSLFIGSAVLAAATMMMVGLAIS